jgi:PAS domain S-box-containing protein
VVESASDFAILTTDLTGIVTSWSPGAEKLLGWCEDEVVGEDAFRIWTPEDREARLPETEMEGARRSGRAEDERWHVRKDGTRFWGSGLMMRFEDEASGDYVGYLKILRDRTSQHEADERLRQSEALARSLFESRAAAARLAEARFRGVFDSVREIYGILTLEGVILEVNRAAADTVGISLTEAVGQFAWQSPWFAATPDAVELLKAALPVAAEGGETRRELTLRLPCGADRTFDISLMPIRDEGGQVILVTISGIDVTDKLATAEQLRQAQKMEAVGQLTGGIAHDFNNLLQGITGSLDLVQKRIAEGRTNDLQRYVEGAMTSAARAAALTPRLRAISRRQPLDPKPVEINTLITNLEDLFRRTIGEHISMTLAPAPGLWPTVCDANQLENALLNLVINARDAMPEGGQLTLETCNVHLDDPRVAMTRDVPPGRYVCICVTDTGTGMSPEVIARAFDPFFTTKPIGQGTGLGLSMIYGFAGQSRGYCRIYSEVGKGTTVKLYLPSPQGLTAETNGAETALLVINDAQPGEIVVVIEDEPTVRELIIEVLEDLGYCTVVAGDGPSGLAILQNAPRVDLLITDIGLPGLNGRQVVDAARLTRPGLKVLFLTGYAENATLANGFLQPGMAMLTKPFSLKVLGTKVREIIQGMDDPGTAITRY